MSYLTTTQAAAALDITRRGVLKAIERGQLPAEKWGRDWRISRDDAEDYWKVREAWELLGITRRVWGKLGHTFTHCPRCNDKAYSPTGIEKYEHLIACPSCGWAEKGEMPGKDE
jgi:excisionase family DNA binding protein